MEWLVMVNDGVVHDGQVMMVKMVVDDGDGLEVVHDAEWFMLVMSNTSNAK